MLAGEIVVVPGCLQRVGWLDALRAASLAGIADALGAEPAATVAARGFESLHAVVPAERLTAVTERAYARVRPLAAAVTRDLVRELFEQRSAYWYEATPNVRFQVPYDATVAERRTLDRFEWHGKITAHGPHHDSWYQCPTNGINVWIALGRVREGNGLTFHPDVYGKRLPCTPAGRIRSDQWLGRGVGHALAPGDALVFHGEHLHSSVLNRTDETRHVVSFRLTLDRPRFLEASPYRHDYLRGTASDGLGARLAVFGAGVAARLGARVDRWRRGDREPAWVLSEAGAATFVDTAPALPPALRARVDGEGAPVVLHDDPDALAVGAVHAVSPSTCVARLSDGRVVAFGRRCPHEGADLAGGWVRDDRVVCPWHGLTFDPHDGASPCRSLPALPVRPVVFARASAERADA